MIVNRNTRMTVDNHWHDTANGGVIMKKGRNNYLARPKGVGMNRIESFDNFIEALRYAEEGIK